MLNSHYNSGNDTRDNSYAIGRLLAKQKPGFQISHLNAQSLSKKIVEFCHLFENSGINVICVPENWLIPTLSNQFFFWKTFYCILYLFSITISNVV